MNDEALDHQLRQLFESERVSVDADGTSARALFDDIVGRTEPVDATGLQRVSSEQFQDARPVVEVVVDLERGAWPQDNEQGPPRHSRSHVALAAMLVLFVLLTASVLITAQDTNSPVASEDRRADSDDDAGAEIPAAEIISGPDSPLVILASNGAVFSDIDSCIERTSQFEADGSGLVAFASVAEPVRFAPPWVVLTDGVSLRECTLADDDSGLALSSSLTPGMLLNQDRPVMAVTGGTGRSDDSDEVIIDVVGVLREEVVSVELIEVDPANQIFRREGASFRIDAIHIGDDPLLEMRAEFVDGSVEPVEFSELVPVCDNRDCVREMIVTAAEGARSGDVAVEQVEVLVDGVLTPAEYSLAEARFIECLEVDAQLSFIPPLFHPTDGPASEAIQACWSNEIAGVEFARAWQNYVLSADDLSRGGGAVVEEPVVESERSDDE